MKKIVVFIFLCIHCLIFAQSEYFEHIVSKGETLYQLSRKYNVRIAQIYNLNPSIEGDLIRIDQVLLIPKNGASSSTITQEQDEEFIYHIVESRETKFGLQRKYGVQISQLESDNPHIIAMLQAGHRVRIRKSVSKNSSNQNLISVASDSNTHTVVKGETLTAISRQYSVNLNELVAANREQLGEFLQIGQRLIIPGQQSRLELSGSNPVHIVQTGETKYGLSRRYNTSIETLERLNPQIVTMLKAGHTLILPTSVETERIEEVVEIPQQETQENQEEVAETEVAYTEVSEEEEVVEAPQQENQENQEEVVETELVYIDEVVEDEVAGIPQQETQEQIVQEEVTQPKESVGGYIDYEVQPKETLYGLSRNANLTQDQLIELNPSLQDGVRIGMILKMPAHVQQSIAGVASTAAAPQVLDASLTDLTKTVVKDSNIKLLLTLPIEMSDYERYKSTKQADTNREEIEFYSGALIAIDSIQKLGVAVEVDLVNTRTGGMNNDYVTSFNPDVIIGTYSQSEKLNTDVPFVYPFTKNFNVDAKLFKALPTKNLRVKMMLDYLQAKNGNVIVIGDVEKTVNRGLITQHLPDAKFLSVNDRTNPEVDNFKNLLDNKNKNYVILDTESTSLFLNATNMMLNQVADYDLQLVIIEDTSVIKNQEVSLMRLRILKTLYTSLYKEQENRNSPFYKKYFSQSKTLPTESAVRGFDVTFDVLLRLVQNKSFNESVESQKTKHNRQEFDYQKTEEEKYQNRAAYILYYDTESDIRKAE